MSSVDEREPGARSRPLLKWLPVELVKIEFTFTFPPLHLLIALVGTVLRAAPLLIMRLPLRRAVHFRRAQALRYA